MSTLIFFIAVVIAAVAIGVQSSNRSKKRLEALNTATQLLRQGRITPQQYQAMTGALPPGGVPNQYGQYPPGYGGPPPAWAQQPGGQPGPQQPAPPAGPAQAYYHAAGQPDAPPEAYPAGAGQQMPPQTYYDNVYAQAHARAHGGPQAAAPQPAPLQPAMQQPGWGQPYYQPPAPKPRRQISGVAIVLALGVFFVLLAGLIFATTNWESFSNPVRLVLLVALTVLFFAAALVSEKKWKIHATGKAFYILGCLFCFVCTLGAGYFALLGPWLRFGGPGEDLLWSLGFWLAALAFAGGVWMYRTPVHLWACGVCATGGMLFLCQQALPGAWDVVVMVACATALLFVARLWRPGAAPTPLRLAFYQFAHLCFGVFAVLGALWSMGVNPYRGTTLLVQAMVLAGLSVMALRGAKLGWYLHPVLCVMAFHTLAGMLVPRAEMARLGVMVLCIAAFWLCLKLRLPGGGSLRTLVSDVLFTLWVGVLCVWELFSWRSLHIAPLCGTLLLCGTFFALALSRQKGGTPMVAAWLVQPMPLAVGLAFMLCIHHFEATNGFATLVLLAAYAVVLVWGAAAVLRGSSSRMRYMELPSMVALLGYTGIYWMLGLNERMAADPVGRFLRPAALVGTLLFVAWLLLRWRRGMAGAVARLAGGGPLAVLGGVLALLAADGLAALALPGFGVYHVTRMLAVALAALGLLALSVYRGTRPHPEGRASVVFCWFAVAAAQLATLWFVGTLGHSLGYGGRPAVVWRFAALAVLVAGYVLVWARKRYVMNFVLPVFLYPMIFWLCDGLRWGGYYLPYWTTGAAVVLLCGVGWVLGGPLLEKTPTGLKPDWLTLTAGLGTLVFVFAGDRGLATAGLLLLAGWLPVMGRKLPGRWTLRVLGTVSAVLCAVAFWVQPWVQWPPLVRTEMTLLPLVLVCVVLRFAIWRSQPQTMNWVCFAATVVCIVRQGADAVRYNLPFDAILLSVACLGILVMACVVRRRSWFLLAAATLLVMAVYQTRWLWGSIAWWVYLLAAGILLITLAAVNEGYRQKGSSISRRLLSLGFFSQWKM